MSPSPAVNLSGGSRRSGTLRRWNTALVGLFLMAWAATDENNWSIWFPCDGQGQDYYNLLVDGLLDGHVHMKVPPDAAGNLPVLMDASPYHGKYYLYFGIVPALLTFLPYSYFSGYDMPQNLATLLLVGGGFVLYLWLYRLARRRYFPNSTGLVDCCTILLLAFGTGTPILLFNGGFYEVALAGGYLCLSAMLLGLYQTLHAERHAPLWLAMASLGGGLAVGCRPTCLLALPILLGPPVLWFRDRKAPGQSWQVLIKGLGAAIIPAAAIGFLLMRYNEARFGDPFEFGFKYQLNALMSSGLPFARFHFIGPNLE